LLTLTVPVTLKRAGREMRLTRGCRQAGLNSESSSVSA